MDLEKLDLPSNHPFAVKRKVGAVSRYPQLDRPFTPSEIALLVLLSCSALRGRLPGGLCRSRKTRRS